jgi:hypothetical protein
MLGPDEAAKLLRKIERQIPKRPAAASVKRRAASILGETPRLCRGGSSNLTFWGGSPSMNLPIREPPRTRRGISRWTELKGMAVSTGRTCHLSEVAALKPFLPKTLRRAEVKLTSMRSEMCNCGNGHRISASAPTSLESATAQNGSPARYLAQSDLPSIYLLA